MQHACAGVKHGRSAVHGLCSPEDDAKRVDIHLLRALLSHQNLWSRPSKSPDLRGGVAHTMSTHFHESPAFAGLAANKALGAHVAQRREAVAHHELGQPHVRDFGRVVAPEQDVGRLQTSTHQDLWLNRFIGSSEKGESRSGIVRRVQQNKPDSCLCTPELAPVLPCNSHSTGS